MTATNAAEKLSIEFRSESDFFDYAYEKGWTDGLPVIMPTDERVAQMVKASGLDATTEIGELAPRGASATVEHIAANAVMAGCHPSHMPVLISAVRALASPMMNLAAVQATTSPATPLLIVNGPLVTSLPLNVSRGCLGPGYRSNATIGRAIRLLLINVGGGLVDEVDKATMGLPDKYSLLLGENEQESPWDSLAIEMGYRADQSLVSVTSVISAINVRVPDPLGVLVSAFRTSYPLIEIRISDPAEGQTLEQTVAEGVSDIGIGPSDSSTEHVMRHTVASQSFMLIAPSTLSSVSGALTFEKVIDERFLVPRNDSLSYAALEELAHQTGRFPRHLTRVAWRDSIPSFVAAGAGVAIILESQARYVDSAAVQCSRVEELAPLAISMIHRRDGLSPAAKAFVSMAVQRRLAEVVKANR